MAINTRTAGTKGKGRIRSLSRKGSQSGKDLHAVVKSMVSTPGPSVCERCGAVFSRRTWRRGRKVTGALLAGAKWTVCPSCTQVESGEYFGRLVIRGAYLAANEDAIRQRIQNVAARAEFTQPQRRIVSISREGNALEVLTTSQKLAHRIVHELKKAFQGKTSYSWSDRDRALFATWERNDVATPKRAGRRR
jgi:NMD protein affecting ribosome stability and mRNA decay